MGKTSRRRRKKLPKNPNTEATALAATGAILAAINPNFAVLTFGGSSIIIVVGVIIEVVQEIDSKLTMRHYKGFLD